MKDLELVQELYLGGLSGHEIGAKLGHSGQWAYRRLKKLGITRPCHGHWFHKQYRGGRVPAGQGYWRVKVSADDPLASMRDHHGYIREHRFVMARALGRPLTSSETVHHINGNRGDNRLENLQLLNGDHGRHIALVCLDCGSHNVVPVKLKGK